MVDIKQRTALCLLTLTLIAVLFISTRCIEPATSCYGPQITSDIDRTEVNIYDTVTVTGQIFPPGENKTIRIAFTRPTTHLLKNTITLIH